ncbi:hypothetical protein STCU_06764 [Strigomonas culicis]|uniref:Calponin-homology (CH) domain-containing protein n=1 Tax=Strigomonas culicis TaxID=28005 RepID=S9U386_9TRYP|nr:hypothetical protein STCU_06764 [Strigomonas culicis]|eukprot:EPY25257.1 hypothetical protein STCU_06764 [Strigomonas culicis]
MIQRVPLLFFFFLFLLRSFSESDSRVTFFFEFFFYCIHCCCCLYGHTFYKHCFLSFPLSVSLKKFFFLVAEMSDLLNAGISAAIDPYEETEREAADAIKLQRWLGSIEVEFSNHKSPFVAAEVILKKMNESATRVSSPDELYLMTTLSVLRHCIPHLSADFRDVASAALREITPAVLFTRARRTPTGEMMRTTSYAECFMRVYRLYAQYKSSLNFYEGRLLIEQRVMDRVLSQLDGLWVKMCFVSWRAHCKRIRRKREMFKRLNVRYAASCILPKIIRSWRQRAHVITAKARVASNKAISLELKLLYEQEVEAKTAHQLISDDVREKMRVAEATTTRCQQAQQRLATLEQLHSETESSIREHWRTWQDCVQVLFADVRALPSEPSNEATRTYTHSITESAAVYTKRSKDRTDRMSTKQIDFFLRFYQLLGGGGDQEEAPSLNAMSRHPYLLSARSLMTLPLTDMRAAVHYLTGPVTAPFHIEDFVQSNQSKLRLLHSFITYVCCGSHFSLFRPQNLALLMPSTEAEGGAERPDGQPIGSSPAKREEGLGPSSAHGGDRHASLLRGPARVVEVPATRLPEDCVEQMAKDVSEGLQQLHGCVEHHDKYLLALRQCVETPEMDVVRDYLGQVFERLSVIGLPVSREKLEHVLGSLVSPSDLPILTQLYPEHGMQSFGDFIHYTTKVSELSGWSLLNLTERLDSFCEVSPMENMCVELSEPDMVLFLHEHHLHLQRLFDAVREEQSIFISREKLQTFLTNVVHLSEGDVAEVLQTCGSAEQGEQWSKADLPSLLYCVGELLDPSPFRKAVEKLGEVLDIIVPYLLSL